MNNLTGDSKPPVIQFTQTELDAYEFYFNLLDPNNTKTIDGKQLVAFFRQSQLPNPILKEIWMICAPNGEFIDHEGFFQALKLISIAQNTTCPINLQALAQNIPTPLPFFKDVVYQPQPSPKQSLPSPNQYEITQEQLSRYEAYYAGIDLQNKGSISGVEAKQLFIKTSLSKEQLIDLWRICDIGEKGFLFKGEFIVAIHLINAATRGFFLPTILPDQLQQLARGNFKICQSLRIGSSSLPIQPRLGSNASLKIQPRIGSNANLGRIGSNANLGQIQPLQVNSGPLSNLFNSITQDKENELNYIKQVNESYRLLVVGIQSEYQSFQHELMRMQNDRIAIQNQNENLKKEIAAILQQNAELQNQIFQEAKVLPQVQQQQTQAVHQISSQQQVLNYPRQALFDNLTPTPYEEPIYPQPQQVQPLYLQKQHSRDSDMSNMFNQPIQGKQMAQTNPFGDIPKSDDIFLKQQYELPRSQQQQQGYYIS